MRTDRRLVRRYGGACEVGGGYDATAGYAQHLANFGECFPQLRALNERHCITLLDFENGDIQERGLQLQNFITNVLEAQGAVFDASEASDAADRNKPFNPLYFLVDQMLGT